MKHLELIRDFMQVGLEAMNMAHARQDVDVRSYRRNMLRCTALTAAGAVCGYVAYQSLKKASESAQQRQAWRKAEAKLDEAIESTLDASDAVAKY